MSAIKSDAEKFIVQVVGYFVSHTDRDDVTAEKARLVFTANREHGVSLSVLAVELAAGVAGAKATKQGGLSVVPSKASLSNYAKAWELATIAGVSSDARSVARLFTTVSASALKPSDLAERAAVIGALSTDAEKVAAAADLPTSKAQAAKSNPAARQGEGEDATTDLKGSEAVTVSAVALGLGILATRIESGQVSAKDVKALTAAWEKVANAVQSLNASSVDVVESALAAIA